MRSSAFTTPIKTNPKRASAPGAPLKELRKKAKTVSPLLLISSAQGETRLYSSNHPLFAEVRGHYDDEEIDLFFTDEMHESVLRIMSNEGLENDIQLSFSEENVSAMKRATLVTFFSEEIFGGGPAQPGAVFRGTIVVSVR